MPMLRPGTAAQAGGILLTAYGVRRPTRDADANAVWANVTPAHLIAVVHDIATVDSVDGVMFDLDAIGVQEIRKHADYPDSCTRSGAVPAPRRLQATVS